MSQPPPSAGAGPSVAAGDASAPVAGAERLFALDLLRGFALLGILCVNMPFFAMPAIADPDFPAREFPGLADQTARWLVAFLAEGKFYPLFSFLFGYGFAVQMARAEAGGARRRYARRLLGLLVLGLAHALLLWAGDILATYAVVGGVLLLFAQARPRTLLRWAAGLLLVPAVLIGLSVAALSLAGPMAATGGAQVEAGFRDAGQRALAVYADGSYVQIFAERLIEVTEIVPLILLVQAPVVLAMFLVGSWAGRRRVLAEPAENRRLLVGALRWGLILGVPGNLLFAALQQGADSATSPGYLGAFGLLYVTGPALSAAYAAGLALLAQSERRRERLAPLAAVGRLALTNYIMQSLVATTIFYSYGLGLFGQVGSAALLALSVALFALQVVLSGVWLRCFRFGPLEWLLRSFTYLRRQPLRA